MNIEYLYEMIYMIHVLSVFGFSQVLLCLVCSGEKFNACFLNPKWTKRDYSHFLSVSFVYKITDVGN